MEPISTSIIAALTLGKMWNDAKRAQHRRHVEATKEAWSPWTGVHGATVESPDFAGTALQGASTAIAMDQSITNADQMKKLQDAQIGAMNAYTKSLPSAAAPASAPISSYVAPPPPPPPVMQNPFSTPMNEPPYSMNQNPFWFQKNPWGSR